MTLDHGDPSANFEESDEVAWFKHSAQKTLTYLRKIKDNSLRLKMFDKLAELANIEVNFEARVSLVPQMIEEEKEAEIAEKEKPISSRKTKRK